MANAAGSRRPDWQSTWDGLSELLTRRLGTVTFSSLQMAGRVEIVPSIKPIEGFCVLERAEDVFDAGFGVAEEHLRVVAEE
ncbi:hypothetical protein PV761_06370, partial [Arthrobacter sp. CC3]|uniref:hypothetical protein n=1 Tax=Arthrobacter sp. CC3 TaxID=3029185 RepID=UPI0032653BE6